jgi:hypothetical protein
LRGRTTGERGQRMTEKDGNRPAPTCLNMSLAALIVDR